MPADWSSIRVEDEDNQPPDGDLSTSLEKSAVHHDALEFPDGRHVLLTLLCEGQAATVLQLPAQPATAAEAHAQQRVTFVG